MMGINLVGGVVHNTIEWNNRHAANLDWIDMQIAEFQGQFSVLVILGQADPAIQSAQSFFDPFFNRVATEYSQFLKVVYMHRNLGVGKGTLQSNFNDIPNLDFVVVEGTIWPSMLIEIDTATGSITVNQDQWYSDHLLNGSV
jgi:hypothetical protein